MLATGKTKTTVAEFAYCGAMYRDVLKFLERKFGQLQAVLCAFLDNSIVSHEKNCTPVIISSFFALKNSRSVGVFRSLIYDQNLSSAPFPDQAIQKIPPNLKETWSKHTVRRKRNKPTLIDSSHWLKDRAEVHERMNISCSKNISNDNSTGAAKSSH